MMRKRPDECSLAELDRLLRGNKVDGFYLDLQFVQELLGEDYEVGHPNNRGRAGWGDHQSVVYITKRSVPGVSKSHPWPPHSGHNFLNWLQSCTYPDPVALLDALRVLEALSVDPARVIVAGAHTIHLVPGAGGVGGGSGAVLGGRGVTRPPPKIK